jgi:uncharacterized protein (TIGR03086 family)
VWLAGPVVTLFVVDPIDDLERGVGLFRNVASGLTADELDFATPCDGWDVRTLVGHVAGVYRGATDALHGERVDLVSAGVDVGDDPARVVADVVNAMMAAWREPGALERTLATTIRDMPAALATRIVIGDSLLHAWDLARALGQSIEMPEDLAAAQFEMMQQYYDPETRGPGKGFDVAITWPEDAPVQDRLVALSGRDPSWSPDDA